MISLGTLIAYLMLGGVNEHHRAGAERFAEAIWNAVEDHSNVPLMVALGAVAWRENRYVDERRSYPPFGLTYYVNTHPEVCRYAELDRRPHRVPERRNCHRITVEEGARRAMNSLLNIQRRQCPGGTWGVVLGRYHAGHGCAVDWLSRAEVERRMRLVPGLERIR